MKKTNKNMVLGMSVGMCLGMSFGICTGLAVFDNVGSGMCLGMSFGMLIGMALGTAKDNKINKKAQEKGLGIKEIISNSASESATIVMTDKNGTEKTAEVSETTMKKQKFAVGDIVFENEDGTIVQAFEKD